MSPLESPKLNHHTPDLPEPLLWTIRQVAQALSISSRSVYRLLAAGDLKLKKIGRSTRVVAASVDRFVNEGAAK